MTETQTDRIVRLALAAGKYRRERDEARAEVERLSAGVTIEQVCDDLEVEIPGWVRDRVLAELDRPSPLLNLARREGLIE